MSQGTSQRSDIAVVMGGLSSIGEDLKVVSAAKAKDVSVSLDTQALVSMKNYFKAHSRPLTHSNKKKSDAAFRRAMSRQSHR